MCFFTILIVNMNELHIDKKVESGFFSMNAEHMT